MSWINTIRKEVKEIKSTKKELKEFGLLVGGVLLVLSVFVFKKFLILGSIIGAILVMLGFFKPSLLKPIYYIWMTIALTLGWFVTRLILLILFIFGILPIKILLRISNKQLIDTKINKRAKTYWSYRQPSKKYATMLEKQF